MQPHHPVHLVRPAHHVTADVPLPVTQPADLLGLGQAGGLRLQLRFRRPAFGDVVRRGIDERPVRSRGRLPHQPLVGSVLAAVPVFECKRRLAPGQAFGFGIGDLTVIRVHELDERLCHQFGRRVAQYLLPCRVEPHEVAVERRDAQHVQRQVEKAVQLDRPLLHPVFQLIARGSQRDLRCCEFGNPSFAFAGLRVCLPRDPPAVPQGGGDHEQGHRRQQILDDVQTSGCGQLLCEQVALDRILCKPQPGDARVDAVVGAVHGCHALAGRDQVIATHRFEDELRLPCHVRHGECDVIDPLGERGAHRFWYVPPQVRAQGREMRFERTACVIQSP